ncbi:MAG: hypothetical protein LUE86_10160, partial [Clostridiales bacterium]|nr:hypothetical protein [Clostridiales bacterium]
MAINSRMEPVGSSALKGMEGIAQFFANLAEGILDYKELNTNHEIKAIMHHIAVKHMAFTDKIDELSKAGSAIEDPEERKRFMDAVEQVEQEGHKVKEGLDEIRRYVRKSGMSEQDRIRMLKEVDRCEHSLQNLYVANVPAYTYKQTMKLVNQNGFMRDVTAVTLSNGNYALFYPMEHAEKMDKILESAALMY